MKQFTFLLGVIFVSLSVNAQTELWGMTIGGGQYGAGTIFKTDGSGNNLITEYSFYQIEGSNPGKTKLVQANDGNLYGTTIAGGSMNLGIIYQFNPVTNIYTKKHEFTLILNGKSPIGGLIQATDGKMYGVASGGTVTPSIYGVLYQFDIITNTYTKKFDFVPATGSFPSGSLIQHTDGNLYGMTNHGGANSLGTLFQYNPITDVYTKKIDFSGVTNGSNPLGELMQASDGNLYGMTSTGGLNNKGTIFQYNPSTNILTKKFDFDGTNSGSTPYAALTQATDGMLYGMTYDGGSNSYGVIFQFDPLTAIFTKKMDFVGTNGGAPMGSLIQASDGKLYGMTYYGGAILGNGILFQYDPLTNIFVEKSEFDNGLYGGTPKSTFMEASDGKLYGLSESGLNYSGVMFQYDPITSAITTKIPFQEGINGRNPSSKLLLALDGMLYGTTSYGGAFNKGTLFQYNPSNHVYTKKMEFDYNTTGGVPTSALVQTSDGMLYGTARDGGVNNNGVIFRYNPLTDTYTNMHNFVQTLTGQIAWGGLALANDGNLYGLTYNGGANFKGTLYQYNPLTNICTKKMDFDGINGMNSTGTLISAADGKLYGTSSGLGTVFQYNPTTDIFIKETNFVSAVNGTGPQGALVQTPDGKFYGTTVFGGANNTGTLFQYDQSTTTITNLLDFSATTNGNGSCGSLILALDGNLYGMTSSGGLNNKGVLFQFNPFTNTYSKKIDFNGNNGSSPPNPNGGLIEIPSTSTNINKQAFINNLIINPNPTNAAIHIVCTDELQSIEVTTITGQVLLSEKIKDKTHQLQLQNFAEGIYFVKVVYYNGMSVTKKVVKQ